jgi:hypothetical protein
VTSTVSVTPVVDLGTVRRLLDNYAAASATLNVAEVQKVYPNLPDLTRRRIDSLRRDFSHCDYSFSSVKILQSSGTEATVQAEGVESCKPKTAQKEIVTTMFQQFQLKKTATGTWILDRVLGQQ